MERPTIKKAVARAEADLKGGSGSQPREAEPSGSNAKYKNILVHRKYIELPPNHEGSKPPAGTIEIDRTHEERHCSFCFAKWWIELGGFKALVNVNYVRTYYIPCYVRTYVREFVVLDILGVLDASCVCRAWCS